MQSASNRSNGAPTEDDLFSEDDCVLSGCDSSQSDDSTELPTYLKTPINKKKRKINVRSSIVNVSSDSLVDPESLVTAEEEEDGELKGAGEDEAGEELLPQGEIFSSDSESDDEEYIFSPASPEQLDEVVAKARLTPGKKLGFIVSLLNGIPDDIRDEEALLYRVNFRYWKERLMRRIYEEYNETVFGGKLPVDAEVVMNPRFLTLGGRCRCLDGDKPDRRIKIELSPKICNDSDRTLEVMVHEMCHGATWVIDRHMDNHGPVWRAWCQVAHLRHPLVPLSQRCHNHKAKFKFEYRCQACPSVVARHSKSVKAGKGCKRCGGELVLFSDGGYGVLHEVDPNKPLNTFAQFVKDKYKEARLEGTSHKEAMRLLSTMYRQEKSKEEEQMREAFLSSWVPPEAEGPDDCSDDPRDGESFVD